MRTWQWSAEDVWALTLAADVRFGPSSYLEDQIWELQLAGGDPAGLAAITTYGGRMRGMQIFPSFALEGRAAVDPQAFDRPIVVEQALPNYARLTFWPLPEIEALAEYWIIDSQRIVGRLGLTARSERSLALDLRLHAVMLPGSDTDPMRPVSRLGVVALQGRVADLQPVIFFSGGATLFRSIFPSLHVAATLAPGERRNWTWAHAGMTDPERGFEAARSAAQLPLDAFTARIERMGEGIVQVETGRPEWDAAVHLSQVAALSSFVGPTRHLPGPAPVLRRGPLDGHAPGGDGAKHDWRWNGMELPAACFLAQQVLPAAPELAQAVVRNALATQGADGAIDARPGLAGQRRHVAAPPLLADLTRRILRRTDDGAFVAEVLPQLAEAFESWFEPGRDRDQDGLPEWDDALQAGYEAHPVFCRTDSSCQGADLRWVESPDLAAWLLREAEALGQLAQAIQHGQDLRLSEDRQRRLREGLRRCWDADSAVFRRVDRSLHTTPVAMEIARLVGNGRVELEARLPRPARVAIRIAGREARGLEIALTGRPATGREHTVRLGAADLEWSWDHGAGTTREAFAALSRIQVRGAADGDVTTARVPNLGCADLAMLLPLCLSVLDPDQLVSLMEGQLLRPEHFWRPYGLPLLPASEEESRLRFPEAASAVQMWRNAQLGEALLIHGRAQQASELLERLMAAIVHALRMEHTFRQEYEAETGQGLGDRNAPCGGVPLSLLLACAGVQLISPTKVGLSGPNVLRGPVTIRWRDLQVTRAGEVTRVVFPDGQMVERQGEEPLVIEQLPRPGASPGAGQRALSDRPDGRQGGRP